MALKLTKKILICLNYPAASIKMHFMVSLIRETYRQLKWIPPYNGVVKNLTTPKYYRGYSLSFECPKLWRIIKHSLHNEMIYKVNCTAIFFFDSNYFKLLISRPSAVCKNESFENYHILMEDDKRSLNVRSELLSKCRHRAKWKLDKIVL